MTAIPTVLGTVDSNDLGFVLMHEHMCTTWPAMRFAYPQKFDRPKRLGDVIEKVRRAMGAGVRTFVDMTTIELGRDVSFIKDVASATGANIILTSGFYHDIPWYFRMRPSETMISFVVDELEQGISDSGVRAAVIKVATEHEPDRMEERILRACAKAHRRTGAPISTHTNAQNRSGLDQLRIFQEEGVDPRRVIIGHSDNAPDDDYLLTLLKTGCSIGLDRFGTQQPLTTEYRVDMILRLCDKGYINQIVLSHDSAAYIDHTEDDAFEKKTPTWNFRHIPEVVVPLLQERGMSAAETATLTVDNPRRVFEQNQPY